MIAQAQKGERTQRRERVVKNVKYAVLIKIKQVFSEFRGVNSLLHLICIILWSVSCRSKIGVG